jgi:protein-tyrosine-phosphatase
LSKTTPLFRVVFVCEGNTCRSPMAVGWARKKFSKDVEVSSAGTDIGSEEGVAPDALDAMRRFGIDISGHSPVEVQDLRLDRFDVVVTLDEFVTSSLLELHSVSDIKDLVQWSVKDPFGRGPEIYAMTASRLEELVNNLEPQIPELARQANIRRTSELMNYIRKRRSRIASGEITGSYLLGVAASCIRRVELILRKERRLCLARAGVRGLVDEHMLGDLIGDFGSLWSSWPHGQNAIKIIRSIKQIRNENLHPGGDRDREMPKDVALRLLDEASSLGVLLTNH